MYYVVIFGSKDRLVSPAGETRADAEKAAVDATSTTPEKYVKIGEARESGYAIVASVKRGHVVWGAYA